jgi:hypothetical protein
MCLVSRQTRPIRSCLMSRQLTRALAGVSLRDETLRLDHLTMAVIDEIDMVGTDDLRQLLTVTTHAGSRRCWSMTPTSWPGQGSRTTMRASSVG